MSPGKPTEDAYTTPEGKQVDVCDSARNQPKFRQNGLQAPRKGGFISDCDSNSPSTSRKPIRSGIKRVLDQGSAKVKAFRLDASDVDSSDLENEQMMANKSNSFDKFSNEIKNVFMSSDSLANGRAIRI